MGTIGKSEEMSGQTSKIRVVNVVTKSGQSLYLIVTPNLLRLSGEVRDLCVLQLQRCEHSRKSFG